MTSSAIINCIIIIGSIILGCHPLDRKRVFAQWVKITSGIISILGICIGVIQLADELRWFALAADNSRILHDFLSFGRGLLLGCLITLAISGQWTGLKK